MEVSALAGIGGALFPSRFLADRLLVEAPIAADAGQIDRQARRLAAWWRQVAATCGPATGVRTLFDVAAMPLAGALGYRAVNARFERDQVRARLEAGDGSAVGLLVLPWARRPSAAWRDAVDAARPAGGDWCLIVAPPFVSLLDARGHASRRSQDFALPAVLHPDSFRRFWILCRATTFARNHGTGRLIDRLVARGATFQDAVRADLQDGVVASLSALEAVLAPARAGQSGNARAEALTLIYRVLFLLFAESRHLVPRHHPIYEPGYAVTSLCDAALGHGSPAGLWDGLGAITRLSRRGCRTDDLIVRPFNGALFAREAAPTLEARGRSGRPVRRIGSRDAAMRTVLAALGSRPGPGGRETISYRDLGVEQLGAVYERVLDLPAGEASPDPDSVRAPAVIRAAPSRRHHARRKQTGTFYTPQPLAEFVVRRTLAPLVQGASADAILALRVLDPAMGSGAFLVAACRYLAAAYERALIDEGRCAETEIDDSARAGMRRSIAERCLAGVDSNPVAVQLARLSLWLTTLSRGKPLGFLDHRLRAGNSLVGAAPDDLARTDTRRRATAEPLPLFDAAGIGDTMRRIARPLLEIATREDEDAAAVHAKSALWARLCGDDSPLAPWRRAADLWCARWFMPAPPSASELRAALDAIVKRDTTMRSADVQRWEQAARSRRDSHGFFHWPLEFADLFYDQHGEPLARPGFDAVIGNPPWEMLRSDDGLAPTGPRADRPRSPLVRFIRESGLYRSCGRGHLNLYQPFLERALQLARPGGRVGCVLPWGLASDEGAAALRQTLLDKCATDTLVGFENAEGLFPIHRGFRFLVIVTSPGEPTREMRCRFGVRTAAEIDALPDRDDPLSSSYPVRLTPETLRRVGGTPARFPDVREPDDLALIDRLMREFPALGSADGGELRFGRELNATDDRGAFGPAGLPVIEGKHIGAFVTDAGGAGTRITRAAALRLLPDGRFDRARLAYRDVSAAGNHWPLIAAVLPAGVLTTHTLFCLRTPVSMPHQHYLCGLFNSCVLNLVVRLLMGSHVTSGLVEGLPAPPWTGTPAQRRIARLAAWLARHPDSAAAHARLQRAVAAIYGLDGEAFQRVRSTFRNRTGRGSAL